jgi:hypothetical protein
VAKQFSAFAAHSSGSGTAPQPSLGGMPRGGGGCCGGGCGCGH